MPSARKLAFAFCVLTAVAGAQHWVIDIPSGFVDLSTSATATVLASPVLADDSTHSFVSTVGNTMFPAGNLRVGNNGALVNTGAVVTTGAVSLTNATIVSGGNAIPTGLGTTASIIAAIAGFWDDLDTQTTPVVPPPGSATEVRYEEIGGNLYVEWIKESHFSDVTGQTITFEIIVFGGASGACAPRVQVVYIDGAFGGTHAAFDYGLSATAGYVAAAALGGGFTNSLYAFNQANSLYNGLVITLVEGPTEAFGVVFSSPGGPGDIKAEFKGSQFCVAGTYFMPVTFTDQYPKWAFGLGITLSEVQAEFGSFPFSGPVGLVIGPLGPGSLPSGLAIYYVTIGYPTGGPAAPAVVGPAGVYVVP
jgi:hypothetical protein